MVVAGKENEVHVRARRNFARISRYIQEETGERFPMWLFKRSNFNTSLCKFPAVYVLLSNEGDILYVGKANNVSERVRSHFEYTSDQNIFMDYVSNIILIKSKNQYGAGILEMEGSIIREFNPIFNTAGNKPLINVAAIRQGLISKYPAYKNEILRHIILRYRELTESANYTKELLKYGELEPLELVLGELSVMTGEYDLTTTA